MVTVKLPRPYYNSVLIPDEMRRPACHVEAIDIRFERADKGRVTSGGPAHVAGLRKDDKVRFSSGLI